MSKPDEESDDQLLDRLGKIGKKMCLHKWRDGHGIWRVCNKPKGHWGKHRS